MKELITITEQNGKKAVSARELYEFLGYNTSQWKRWYTKNILKNEFAAMNEDYVGFDMMSSGNKTMDFALSINFAKKLSMLAKTEQGEKARDYFIACEEKLIESSKPLSQIEIILKSAQVLLEQDKRINQIEDKVKTLEAKSTTTSNYFTVVGYANLHNIACGLKLASSLGRKASRLCAERDILTESLPDPRFGKVKTYPYPILDEVFNQPIK